MIPQGYELWAAEAYPEGGAAPAGRIVGWSVDAAEPRDWASTKPVVAFEADGKPTALRPAVDPWFVGPTRDAAVAAADAYVKHRDAPARRQREQERHRKDQQAWADKVRRATEEGDLRFLHAAVVRDVRQTASASIVETIERDMQLEKDGERSVTAWLPRSIHESMVPIYDKAIRAACEHVLGEGSAAHVEVKPRKLFG